MIASGACCLSDYEHGRILLHLVGLSPVDVRKRADPYILWITW